MLQSDFQKVAWMISGNAREEVMFTVQEVAAKIARGQTLALAGDIELLKKVPAGDWIGEPFPTSWLRRAAHLQKRRSSLLSFRATPNLSSSLTMKAQSLPLRTLQFGMPRDEVNVQTERNALLLRKFMPPSRGRTDTSAARDGFVLMLSRT
jgi:hypothetical protein